VNFSFQGLNFFLRKIITSSTPDVQLLNHLDGTYTYKVMTTFRDMNITFTPNVEFDEEFPDGSKVKCKVTFEGNKMIKQQYKTENASRIEREFFEDQMIEKSSVNGVEATRWFKPV
jgi:translation initiation factor IF-3